MLTYQQNCKKGGCDMSFDLDKSLGKGMYKMDGK